LKNLYKFTHIFSCVHESHRGYKNKMSVYHILKEKKCYPHGCIYFRWLCKQLNKRKKCDRGFKHVGRKCFGCKYFYEEKIHNYPVLQVSETEYQNFLKELDIFEDWLKDIQERELEIDGTVDSVKPLFVKKIYPKTEFISFRGYLIVFKEIFLGRDRWEDYAYARISADYYDSLKLGVGDRLEARARVKTDRGRIILHRLKSVMVINRGQPAEWSKQNVLLARETATQFPEQPEKCVQCPFGALVDVENHHHRRVFSSRQLLCLKGILNYRDCYVKAEYCGLDKEANDLPDKLCLEEGSVSLL